MTLTAKKTYKGQDIYIIEDALGQTFNVVIGCFDKIFHTTADAKRYINHKEDYTYLPITPSASGNFNEIMGFARKTALQAPEQEFNSKRDALKAEMDAIIAEGEERVSEFIQSTLKGYGDFRLTGYTPDYFYVTLHKDDKPVFGAEWKIYMSYDWSTKSRSMACSFGIGGNFALGKGSEQEMLHIAFARFLTMSQEVRLDKYLLKVWEQADNVWSRFHALCKEYNKNSMTSLFAEAK